MPNNENLQWITVNGAHIPVEAGKTKKEATKTFLQKVREKKQTNKEKQANRQIEKNDKTTEEKNKKIEKEYNKIRTKEYLKSVRENPQKEILRGNPDSTWLLTEIRGFGKEQEGWEIVKNGKQLKKYNDRQEAYNDWDKGYFETKDSLNTAQDKKEIDHNDFWYIKDNPLSKVGVFPYLGRQISPELEPDKIYQVLRPEEELSNQKTLDSFKLVPIVDDHTMLGTRPGMQPAEEKGVHGVIGDDVYYKDGVIYGDLKIFSESLKEEIENGKKELSMGYFCDYEIKDGEFNGEPYQAIQRNLRINHVALVDEGRMGADVRVMDRQITFDSIKEIKDMTKMQKQSLGKSALDEDIEAITKDECKTQDGDVDKRALIDEIGGMLKDKVDEELWRTIVGKLEQLSYNDSETGANDEETDVEEEKKTTDEEIIEEPAAITEAPKEGEEPAAEVTVSNGEAEVTVSLDSMIKEIGQRDALVEAVRPLIGDNSKYKMMSTKEVAKYACDKLDLKVSNGQEVSVLRGYIAATKKNQNKVNYSLDSAVSFAPKKDAALEAYMKGGN